jgi:hypothetical protein
LSTTPSETVGGVLLPLSQSRLLGHLPNQLGDKFAACWHVGANLKLREIDIRENIVIVFERAAKKVLLIEVDPCLEMMENIKCRFLFLTINIVYVACINIIGRLIKGCHGMHWNRSHGSTPHDKFDHTQSL